MDAIVEETAFLPFVCPVCRQEIEAPTEMAGRETECPACAALIQVPGLSESDSFRSSRDTVNASSSPAQLEAMKSRTIRIELPDSW